MTEGLAFFRNGVREHGIFFGSRLRFQRKKESITITQYRMIEGHNGACGAGRDSWALHRIPLLCLDAPPRRTAPMIAEDIRRHGQLGVRFFCRFVNWMPWGSNDCSATRLMDGGGSRQEIPRQRWARRNYYYARVICFCYWRGHPRIIRKMRPDINNVVIHAYF